LKTELITALDHQTDLQKGLLDQTAERFDGVIKNSIAAFEKQSDVLRDFGVVFCGFASQKSPIKK